MRFDGLGRAASSRSRTESSGRCDLDGRLLSRRAAIASVIGFGSLALLSACGRTAPEPVDAFSGGTERSVFAWRDGQSPLDLPPEEVVAPVRPIAPPPRPFDGVEISFRFGGLNPASEGAVRAAIVEFFKLTGITVWPRTPAGQGAPDIWYGGGLWTPVLAAKGQVLELDDYVASWDEWEDFYPGVREDVSYDGHVMGIPYRTNYRGSVVFRPSMFERAGLAPEPPGTWEELNELAPKLTVRDGDTFEQAGFNLQHHTQVYEDWLRQAGGGTFNEDLTKPSNDTPAGRMALAQHVRHGLQDGSMPREGIDSRVPNLHAFCAGRVAIQQLWPGNVGNCETNAGAVFDDLEVAPPLQGPARRVMQLYVDKYMPWKLTRNPDAVFETLKYFASPGPNYEINVLGDRSMPCRYAMEGYDLYQSEPYRTYAANVQFGETRKVVPEHFDVQPAMSRWVEKAALGELSVDETLRGMDAEVLEIITGT